MIDFRHISLHKLFSLAIKSKFFLFSYFLAKILALSLHFKFCPFEFSQACIHLFDSFFTPILTLFFQLFLFFLCLLSQKIWVIVILFFCFSTYQLSTFSSFKSVIHLLYSQVFSLVFSIVFSIFRILYTNFKRVVVLLYTTNIRKFFILFFE